MTILTSTFGRRPTAFVALLLLAHAMSPVVLNGAEPSPQQQYRATGWHIAAALHHVASKAPAGMADSVASTVPPAPPSYEFGPAAGPDAPATETILPSGSSGRAPPSSRR